MSTIVECPSGHRFPVNPKKHLNRRERYCPKCRTEVVIRKRFSLLPNPDWTAMKEGYRNAAEKKRVEKERVETVQKFFEMFGARGKRRQKHE